MKYRAEIDGLRAVAVVPVILFHAGFELFSGGFVGVDVFFVISGYLITTILIEEIEKDQFSIVNFYERRARRILPILYLVVISTLIVSMFVLYPEDLVSLAKSAISIPIFSSNFFFWSERGYFGGATELKPLVHTWSLAVEEQFYIVFPPLLLLIYKLGSRYLTWTLFLIFLLSLISSYYVTLIHFDTAFYFPFTRAWELLIGAFCALFLFRKTVSIPQPLAEALSFFGLAFIAFAYFTFDSTTLFPYVNALIPTLGTAIFIISSTNSVLLRKLLSLSAVVYIGLISFSLYLWHQPLFALARHLSLFENNVVILIAVTIVLSVTSYYVVEKPFRNKRRVNLTTLITYGVVGTVLIVALGGVIVFKNGFPSRYAVADQKLLAQLASYKGYNQVQFDSLQFRSFSPDSKRKVVIVGDSYAKDFVNVLIESGMFTDFEFSTRQVNSECGNLLLTDYDAIQVNIPRARAERCKVLGRYEGDDFDRILTNADEIWLVSSWEEWVVDLLPTSLKNLDQKYGKPIRVFGNKDFGAMNSIKALSISNEDRATHTQPVREYSIQIANRLDDVLKSYEYYYPIMDDLCGGDLERCKVFTDSGLLMSVDGEHLTQEGAIEAGVRLQSTLSSLKISP
ncbi:acyltransferase [Rhodobacteraceae bacterium B1Z28]|uniref:Acyltransferase n=1 Tax=Ruegeria haliotis TaxID=2747601 RepID=A0ABX2PVU4_9RHOB|nr:acyltransferase [Ruegeria haliotis]NVO58314.1 acyltransferase [Ruegeria haliotis]